jgi:hypothetical protein
VPEAKLMKGKRGWTYAAAPYFWAAGLSGDMAQFGLPAVHIDSDFADILDNLDFALMAAGEARYDRFSIFADIMYTKLGADANTRNSILADSVDVTSKTFAGLLGAGYSVLESQSGHLDIVGGVRVWSSTRRWDSTAAHSVAVKRTTMRLGSMPSQVPGATTFSRPKPM